MQVMTKDCVSVWNGCLNSIKGEVNEQSYKTWFEPIVPVRLVDNILTIQVPTQFFYEWLEEHYVGLLKKAIFNELGNEGRLEYSIIVDKGSDKSQPISVNIPNRNNSFDNKKNYHNPFEVPNVTDEKPDSQLNPNYTFDTFIEGDCNRLGRSAGIAVANNPGKTSFNPLFLYGGVGLGKTHLAQAIGNEVKKNDPSKFVLYVSSEKFSNQFINAVKEGNIQGFANFYLQVDVLIIDDVQFFANKEKTQEIFFNIFNSLHQTGKQIVMTSDCPPKELKGLEERLLSRFKWGLSADLQQPDFETRIAIIDQKMQDDGIFVPPNVIEYIAYTIDTNVRELEGVLISLIAQSSLIRKDIDLELAKSTIQSIVQDVEGEVSIDYIQKLIADYFDIEHDQLKAKVRKKEIVIARQVAMYFVKEYTNHSLKAIGSYFGGRDHSTVIHSIQSVNDMMDTDKSFKKQMRELTKKLKMRTV